mmetsp:Transcript_110857/g.207820  ORF Transcript_110857/g.207820 Transcript_110857/m.207820 type:complete len:154 (+) Transcript_110857:902-1363(+)
MEIGSADTACASVSGLVLTDAAPKAGVVILPTGAVSEPPAHGPGAGAVTVEVVVAPYTAGAVEAPMACATGPGGTAVEPPSGAMREPPSGAMREPPSEGAMVIFQDHTVPVSVPTGLVPEVMSVVVIGSGDIDRGDIIGDPGRGMRGEPALGN